MYGITTTVQSHDARQTVNSENYSNIEYMPSESQRNTSVDPVNDTLLTSWWLHNAAPAVGP